MIQPSVPNISIAQVAAPPAQPLPQGDSVNFKQLFAGQKGKITSLTGNPQDIATLAELGLCRGTEINVIRQGLTAIVRFNSQQLCLRLGHDVHLLVHPIQ